MSLRVNITKKLNSFTLHAKFEAGDDVFSLLGASGCGKSMTLKCIAGIEQPDSGRIVLGDRVLFDSEKKINLPPQKRRIGYMFQDYALFPNMTVRQNVAAGMGRHPDREKVNALMERFRIAELAERNPTLLSGGQKQRVAMARIVGQEPDVILLDEPFSALDAYLKWQLEQEMKDILREVRKPTVFVSHSRDEVYHLCSKVGCMTDGQIEVIQPVKKFFENPETRTAAILSGCKNVVPALCEGKTVSIPEWGLRFETDESRPGETAFAGVRAHYFSAEKTEPDMIEIPVLSPVIREDLFEWTVMFHAKEQGTPIQWKVFKSALPELEVPDRLYLKKSDIMLLRDGGKM